MTKIQQYNLILSANERVPYAAITEPLQWSMFAETVGASEENTNFCASIYKKSMIIDTIGDVQ